MVDGVTTVVSQRIRDLDDADVTEGAGVTEGAADGLPAEAVAAAHSDGPA